MSTTLDAHLDVVCPPAAAARCTCDAVLSDHLSGGLCPTSAGPGALPQVFELADGETFDYPHTVVDDVCDVEICADHSTEFTTCVANPHALHHLDCAYQCPSCVSTMRAEGDV